MPFFWGSYAGVLSLEFNARHSGNGDGVDLRAYLFNGNFGGGGDHSISSQIISIPNTSTNWQTYTIPLTAPDLSLIQGTIAGLLSNVTQLGLRHDPASLGAMNPVRLPNGVDLFFDDLVLRGVPEPSGGILAALATLALASLRWR